MARLTPMPPTDVLDLPPLPPEVYLLDPDTLDAASAMAAREISAQGTSDNSLRSYRSGVRYWCVWFWLRFGRPLDVPVTVPTVTTFVVDHAQRYDADGHLVYGLPAEVERALVASGAKKALGAMSLATLSHRLAVLSKLHDLKQQPNPVRDASVQQLMDKVRRSYAARGAVPKKAPALCADPLRAILSTCEPTLLGLRDCALLHFGFSSGGRRRSEVAAAIVENLTAVGDREYLYRLHKSKTRQSGARADDAAKPVVGAAADALRAWLLASGITSGPIFRSVRRSGSLGPPLRPEAVREIVVRRAALAGLPPGYTAHSLRSGFVTEAAAQGVSMAETMALTDHSSVQTLIGYFRTSSSLSSRAARLLDASATGSDSQVDP